MKTRRIPFLAVLALTLASCGQPSAHSDKPSGDSVNTDSLRYPQETHLRNVRRLTNGGNNAEAYWSFDSRQLVFQSDYAKWGNACDQIHVMDMKGALDAAPPRVSTGKGRTTCSYFLPGDSLIVYASTHLGNDSCPPVPDRKAIKKYVWPIYDTYDIFVADLKGNIRKRLTNAPGYDAEATVSPDGKMIVFTSTRSGDLELWTMNADGSNPKQVTKGLGYDGGAFFSPDGKKLVFRASRPTTKEEVDNYKSLLKQGLVEPGALEIYTCNLDGSDLKQITHLGKANWAPFFHPSGNKILFASNHKSEKGFQFNLFLTDLEGNNIEQVTHDNVFDSFAMFSPDGKKLVFCSNRFNGGTHDTNVFVADWVE